MSFHTDKEALSKKYAIEMIAADRTIGGYKISILNHPSRTEYKFTITGTDGYFYVTNKKEDFMKELRGIVWRIQN